MSDRVHSGALPPGTRAGRYEVESFLGAGGMGEIYVARDTILGRRIALKVLPSGCDRDRIARFLREAKASSALNHPAIVSVHDAGSADGIHFLAMELIDGEPLSLWMQSHRDITRATELMAQVADGLACAHAAGIVHRDLKPANIMIGRAGFAKIVDFGVAKLGEQSASPEDATDVRTAGGLQVGTVSYMSPEQVEGGEVDYRSDIFSLGVVLYELFTGVHPFASANPVATIHNIVHLDPSMEAVPTQCRRIVARCLAKEPGRRYQSMADIAHDLRDSLAKPKSMSQRRRWPAWLLIAAVLVLIGVFVFVNRQFREKPAPAITPRQRSTQQVTNSGKIRAAAISPDGKFLVYAEEERGLRGLWVKQIATEASTRIVSPSTSIYWSIKISPDSNYVYFMAAKPPDFSSAIYRVPILGGEPRAVVSRPSSAFDLSPDGRHIAFFRYSPDSSSLVSTAVDGLGERTILTLRDFGHARLPAWSPDGEKIAFVETATRQREQRIEEVVLETRAQRTVSSFSPQTIWTMTWLPDGSGTLISAGDVGGIEIWSVPISGAAPVRVTADVGSYFSPSLTDGGQSFAAVRGEDQRSITVLSVDSDGGTQVVSSGLGDHLSGEVRWTDANHIVYDGVTAGVRTLFIIPRGGGQPQQIIHGMSAWHPSVSQDGKHLAFLSDRSGSSQVWLSDFEGNAPNQLTSGGDGALTVEFSADAKSVYYGDHGGAFRVPITGGIPEDSHIYAERGFAVSRDGRWLMSLLHREAGPRVYLYPLPIAVPPRTFGVPPSSLPYTRFHPSSRSFGFIGLSENGVHNIYLQNIDGGALRQITHFDHGDIYAFDWSPDGKWLAVACGEPRRDVVIVHDFR
jgi:Tol biopolymer transport system component